MFADSLSVLSKFLTLRICPSSLGGIAIHKLFILFFFPAIQEKVRSCKHKRKPVLARYFGNSQCLAGYIRTLSP